MNWISCQDKNLYNLQLKYTRNISQNIEVELKTKQNKQKPALWDRCKLSSLH